MLAAGRDVRALRVAVAAHAPRRASVVGHDRACARKRRGGRGLPARPPWPGRRLAHAKAAALDHQPCGWNVGWVAMVVGGDGGLAPPSLSPNLAPHHAYSQGRPKKTPFTAARPPPTTRTSPLPTAPPPTGGQLEVERVEAVHEVEEGEGAVLRGVQQVQLRQRVPASRERRHMRAGLVGSRLHLAAAQDLRAPHPGCGKPCPGAGFKRGG
jgi:hypothetical protein